MELKICTFNVRSVYLGEDGVNSFLFRSGMILEKIREESPDLICFQEVIDPIRDFFKRHLDGYDLYGHGRNADRAGEGVTIAVKRGLFDLVDFESFWLSPTPHVPASRYPKQSQCPRICLVAVLRAPDAKLLRVVGVHLDHVSDEARILGIKQIVEYLAAKQTELPCDATVVLGDFNATPASETMKWVDRNDVFPLVEVTRESGPTFHWWGRLVPGSKDEPRKIDFIYLDPKSAETARDLTVWRDENCGIYLSDHYPFTVKFDL
ncbi:MAG: endonuclease/exonuclease/phosphatase family protein [Clostridia bacterium]|nr:endonuclease/exonuclease/phosphatase family protein [Clostridia bacterium]